MVNNFEEFQSFGKEQLDAATAVAASLARGFQTVSAAVSVCSRQWFENNSTFVENLLEAKSLNDAVRIQSDFAKSNYERFFAQATKIGELYTSLVKEAFAPIESAVAKVQAAVAPRPATPSNAASAR